MPILLEFVAFSDAELQWLVAALQGARASLPWRPLSVRAHDGAWILRVQGPLALYHEITSTRASVYAAATQNGLAPFHGQNEALYKTGVTLTATGLYAMSGQADSQGSDRLALFMRDACKPWPPGTAESRPAKGAAAEMRASSKNARRDAKNGSEKDSHDSSGVVKSTLAKKGQYAGANWQGHSFALQDLRGADFSGADLRGADFHGANLQGASFRNAQLGQPQAETGVARWRLPAYQLLLDKPRFWTLAAAALLVLAVGLALLLQAGYAGASLAGLLWVIGLLLLDQRYDGFRQKLANRGTRFDAANLLQADFSGAHIGLVNFEQAPLQQVRWHGAVWKMPLYFSDPVLGQRGVPALLAGQRGQHEFSGVDLSAQNLSGLDLSGFDFSAANLQTANLIGCNLQGARLAAANLCGANLSLANLSGADLSDWQTDTQTRLTKVECSHWYIGCSRWPPEPHSLRQGEFVHLIPSAANSIRFLARDLTHCDILFDTLLHLAQTIPVRIVGIGFDPAPASHACTILTAQAGSGQESGDAPAQPKQAAYGYQIEVQTDTAMNAEDVCRKVWQASRSGIAAAKSGPSHTSQDRLSYYLATLSNIGLDHE